MNMIDVMKRLAELDSQNPNVVNESKMAELDDDLKTMSAEEFKAKYKKTKAEARAAMKPDAKESLAECGMMPMPGMSGMSPSSPANISITAGSGPELSGMLKDIMSLAGIQRSEPAAMPTPMTAEPEIEIEPAEPEDDMRSMIDKMNEPDDDAGEFGDEDDGEEFGDEDDGEEFGDEEDEKAAEGMYDNSPDIDIEGPESLNRHSYQGVGGPPGAAKGRGLTTGPRAHTAEDVESQLFAEYAKFVTEAAPSAGMTKKEKSAVVKKAKAGKDIGKPGKGFEKVEKAAAKGGAKDPKAVAGAAMWKGQVKKKVKEDVDDIQNEAGYGRDGGYNLGARTTNKAGFEMDKEEWFRVQDDGKMYTVSIWPNQRATASKQGWSPSREQAKAKAGSGMQNEAGWDQDKRDFKKAEMEFELGHERNNYEVVINGRGWKVFADKRQADNIARVLRSKGKDATVQITGASPTA